MIHTVKGFGIVNKAEIDVFLELTCFFDDPADVGNLISGSSAFSKILLKSNARPRLLLNMVTFFHKGGVICISEVIDISPTNLDSRLCFFQTSISHDVLCI